MRRLVPCVLVIVLLLFSAAAFGEKFPPVPKGIKPIFVADGSEVADMFFWAQGGDMYMKVVPKVGEIYMSPSKLEISQDGVSIDSWDVDLVNENGDDFFGNIRTPSTFKVEGPFDADRLLIVSFDNYECPRPTTEVAPNGNAGVAITSSATAKGKLTLSLHLFPANLFGTMADWWLYIEQGGNKYVFSGGKLTKMADPAPFYQGPLGTFTMDTMTIPTTGLKGKAKVHFGIDKNMDGKLTGSSLDEVTRNVTLR